MYSRSKRATTSLDVGGSGHVHLHRVLLPAVAHVGEARQHDFQRVWRLVGDLRPPLRLEACERRIERGEVDLVQPPEHRMHVVVADIGDQHAGCRKRRRQHRHQDGADAEFAGDVDGVDRSAATLCDHDEVARIAAALDGDAAHRAGHDEVRDAHDAFGDFERLPPEPGAEPLDCRLRRRHIERHLSAKEVVGIDPSEHRVGVRDRRFAPAPAVADRSGPRSGAARSDLERLCLVQPRDAAAASSYFHHVEHRRLDREAAIVAADEVQARQRRLAVLDQAAFRGRPAHVERDQVAPAHPHAEVRAADHPGDRTQLHEERRMFGCRIHGDHAAARFHDEEAPREPVVAQPGIEADLDVAGNAPPDIGVHDGSRRALVFAQLTGEFGRRRDEGIRHRPAHKVHRLGLVAGIGVGIEEGDSDRLDIRCADPLHHVSELLAIEWRLLFATARHAPGDFEAQVARDQRVRPPVHQVVGFGPVAARDLEDVPEALRRDQRRPAARALDDGVDDDGGAVKEVVDVLRVDAGFRGAVEDALRQVFIGGQALDRGRLPRIAVEGDEVRKGPADIDADEAHDCPLPCCRLAAQPAFRVVDPWRRPSRR